MVQTGFGGLKTWFKALVLLSFALNLLIIGFVSTAWIRHGGMHRGHPFAIERSLMHFARKELPRERKRALRQIWRKERTTFRPLFKDLRLSRRNVGEALERTPYDRDAVRAALNGFVSKRNAAQEKMQDVFLRMIETLSDEEKQAFGSYLKKMKSRGHWRRRHHKNERD